MKAFLEERLRRKSHAVIVVTEEAGQELVPVEGTDTSGNKKASETRRRRHEEASEAMRKLLADEQAAAGLDVSEGGAFWITRWTI